MARNAAVLSTVLTMAIPAAAFAQPGVEPGQFADEIQPGIRYELTKTVNLPVAVPALDVYFLADTTGSMGASLANVQANATEILNTISAEVPDSQFGAGNYLDFQSPTQLDPYAFQNDASIGPADGALAGISSWTLGGGFDGPEGQLYALHRIASGDAGYRPDATRVLVWFGDAPGHDPVCSEISGEPADITEASVAAELVAAGIRIISISVTSGYPQGLNDAPTSGGGDYVTACGVEGGTPGQADRLSANTLGASFVNVAPSEVSATILDGIEDLEVLVTPQVDCPPGVSVEFDAPNKVGPSGGTVEFTETVTMASPPPAPMGEVLTCTVDFLLDGVSAGPEFVQTIDVSSLCELPPSPAPEPMPTEPGPSPTAIPTANPGFEPGTTRPPPDECPLLPDTGTAAPLRPLLIGGAVVIGVGVALLLATSRSRRSARGRSASR